MKQNEDKKIIKLIIKYFNNLDWQEQEEVLYALQKIKKSTREFFK